MRGVYDGDIRGVHTKRPPTALAPLAYPPIHIEFQELFVCQANLFSAVPAKVTGSLDAYLQHNMTLIVPEINETNLQSCLPIRKHVLFNFALSGRIWSSRSRFRF
jgi:hypothetical protein